MFWTALASSMLGNLIVAYGGRFISATLLPDHLAPVYETLGPVPRLIIALLVCSAPANYLIGSVWRWVDPCTATMILLGSVVASLLAVVVTLDGVAITGRVLAASVGALAAILWFGYEVSRSTVTPG